VLSYVKRDGTVYTFRRDRGYCVNMANAIELGRQNAIAFVYERCEFSQYTTDTAVIRSSNTTQMTDATEGIEAIEILTPKYDRNNRILHIRRDGTFYTSDVTEAPRVNYTTDAIERARQNVIKFVYERCERICCGQR